MIVVWFSCGAASAVAAKLTIEKFSSEQSVRVVNNPVAEEDEDNRRFLVDVEKWIGQPIEIALNPSFPNASAREVWEKRRYMSGIHGAPCTVELKKLARQEWEKLNHPLWHVLGFTAEEKNRFDRFRLGERPNTIPILIDAGLTKQNCIDLLIDAGIKPPRIYDIGFPNANCVGCVKATSPSYWNLVRRTYPEVFTERAEQSRRLGVRLVRYQGKRIQLDKLPENATGRRIKNMLVECGIFCEEK